MEIELNGKKETLVFSVKAATAVSRAAGGFVEAVRRVSVFDLDLCVAVITAGLERPYSSPADLAEAVHKTGVMTLSGPLAEYCSRLANGGRPIGEPAKPEA